MRCLAEQQSYWMKAAYSSMIYTIRGASKCCHSWCRLALIEVFLNRRRQFVNVLRLALPDDQNLPAQLA